MGASVGRWLPWPGIPTRRLRGGGGWRSPLSTVAARPTCTRTAPTRPARTALQAAGGRAVVSRYPLGGLARAACGGGAAGRGRARGAGWWWRACRRRLRGRGRAGSAGTAAAGGRGAGGGGQRALRDVANWWAGAIRWRPATCWPRAGIRDVRRGEFGGAGGARAAGGAGGGGVPRGSACGVHLAGGGAVARVLLDRRAPGRSARTSAVREYSRLGRRVALDLPRQGRGGQARGGGSRVAPSLRARGHP